MKFPGISALYSLFLKFPTVITDNRKASAPNKVTESVFHRTGSIFFALKGEKFNGNQFAESALKSGCNYAVIDDEEYYKGEKFILVKDCLAVLQELARHHREHLKIPFIAITGSNGKTTTKELIRCVLSKKYTVLATAGNLNNHIGVPLTILSVTPDIEIAVIEMGANHTGEIAMLCEIAQPDFGIITNIGKAHLGEFGSMENVVKTKTEIYDFIRKKKGKVFINSDNDLLMSKVSDMEKITYGTSGNCFCTCRLSETTPYLKVNYEKEIIPTQLIGKYNLENVSAAICIGKYFGLEIKKIKEAIEGYTPSNNRSQVIHTKKNILILDAYNANPSSMREAIENFYDLPAKMYAQEEMKGSDKWLILGDMLELGKYEMQEHKSILSLLSEKNFQNVILVGPLFSKAMSELSYSFPNQLMYKDSDELATRLKTSQLGKNPALILIKGSRGIKLEKVVEYL